VTALGYPTGRKRTNYPERSCSTCGRTMPACCLPKHERTHGDPRLRLSVPLEQQDEIVRLYNQRGGSLATVAAQTFWSQGTVLDVLRANGVPMRSQGSAHRKISVEQELERCELYGQGLSIHEVADRVGVTYEAVRQTLVRSGREIRRQGDNLRWKRNLARSEAAPNALGASSTGIGGVA